MSDDTRPLRVVRYQVEQGVASIQLDRPDVGNAIDLTMAEDFYEAVFRAAADPVVRAVLLGGTGRSFSVGGDLVMMSGLDAGQLSRRLRRLVDLYHLSLDRLILLNRPFTAAEALDWGLVTEVVPSAEVEDRARALAARLAAGPTQAFGRMKRLLRDSSTTDRPGQLNAETTQMSAAGASDDAAEGIAAFVGKRSPTFHGC